MLPGSIVFVHPSYAGHFGGGIFPIPPEGSLHCWYSVGRLTGRPYIIDNAWLNDCFMCNATVETQEEVATRIANEQKHGGI